MPLLKRKPFSLLEPPKDLDPKEKIFQVRFTKEIFRDYQEFLKRLNLYRQRLWTCKVSGKSNLTFEEALVSEHNATEKAQKLPTELMAHILQMTQYNTLGLNELVNKIYANLQEEVFKGVELHAKKDGSEAPCKILKILDSGDSKMYEVGWFGRGKTVISTSVVKAADLIQRRAPVSRNILRIFIRDAASQSTPWVIHEHLSKKYGIPNEPPEDILYREGLRKRGRKRHDDRTNEDGSKKLKRNEGNTDAPTKYPIDDLLLRPVGDDPAWSKRPPLATDFRVPRHSVGDLLMVWDFCLSFGRLLKLAQFSLTDLENAICHKESNVLVVEIHAAIFLLLMKDQGEYFTILKNKKRKLKVSLVTWAEYLCDFLEITKIEDLASNISTVRRGYYGLIDTDIKLKILRELVEEAVTTSAIREILSERVDQKQALAATTRGARKDKEEQNLNPGTAAENEKNQIGGVQNGSGNVDDQVRGIELDKNNSSRGKTDGKWHLVRKLETEEKLSIRSSPLGKDRHHNRYWFFRREGRLFVESADSREWGYYNTKEELDALMGSLNVKGIRERALKRQLEKFHSKISTALEKRSKDIAHKMLLEEAVPRRSTRVRAQPKDNPSMAFLNSLAAHSRVSFRRKPVFVTVDWWKAREAVQAREGEMAQHMLSASGGIFVQRGSKPQATLVRGRSLAGIGIGISSRQFLLACNASSSPSPSSPAPPQEDADCNEEECAPEKEVGSLSAEWLAEERTQVVGTFPPKRKKGWTGLVEKDTAGQTNIYSVEPTVYVAESAISSGSAGTSAEGAENTAAIAGGLVLITVAAASSILIQVSKNQPPLVPAGDYTGPPLSYYVAKFQPQLVAQDSPEAPAPETAADTEPLSS